MQLEIFPTTIIYILAVAINLLSLVLIWIKPSFAGRGWLLFAILSVTLWNFFVMLATASVNLSDRLVWAKLEYLGASTASPLLLSFFLNYPVTRLKITFKKFALLMVIPLISILAVMTNDWHHLFWTSYTLFSSELNIYIFGHGFFYWASLVYNYICGTFVVLLLVSILRQYRGLYRTQAATLLPFSVFPYLAGIIYSFGFTPLPGLDIPPLGYTIGCIGIVICVVIYRMMDLVPVGRDLIVEKMADGLIVINQRNQIVDINPVAKKIFAIEDLQIGDLISKAGNLITIHFMNKTPHIEMEIPGTPPRYLELKTTPLTNKFGKQIGTMGIVRDITEFSKMKMRLEELATHDSLTGLPNRRLFFDQFYHAAAYAQRNNQKLAVLSLDLDKFKDINDYLGHPIGDQILIEVGKRLTHTLRRVDTIARFGGDEFMILLCDIGNKANAAVVVNKILDRFRQPYLVAGNTLSITVSIGIALFPDDGKDIQDLINRSDKSLYFVKENGKDYFQFFDELDISEQK